MTEKLLTAVIDCERQVVEELRAEISKAYEAADAGVVRHLHSIQQELESHLREMKITLSKLMKPKEKEANEQKE